MKLKSLLLAGCLLSGSLTGCMNGFSKSNPSKSLSPVTNTSTSSVIAEYKTG